MLEILLDSIAQDSAYRRVHPGTKVLLGLGSLIICLLSPSPYIPLLSGICISALLLVHARVPPVIYGELLLGPGIFLGMSVIVLLFLTGGGTVIWSLHISSVTLTITDNAVMQGALIICKVFGCMVSVFFISLTTPITDLFNGMKRFRVPIELIDLMMIMYRYIFIIYQQTSDIWHAQKMRLGYSRPKESVHSFAMLCGTLFISSWNAGEDLVHAMDCRCYDGKMPSLDNPDPIRVGSLIPVIGYLVFLLILTGALISLYQT